MSPKARDNVVPASAPASRIVLAHADGLSASQLYAALKLRVDVFVVEQACPYAELDGLDLVPGTDHLWVELGGDEVVATLRILTTNGSWRIGRVATARAHRGKGYAAALMRAALVHLVEGEVTLEAQAHLEQWYAGFGFIRAGGDYIEDGIPHVSMRLAR